MYDFKFGGGSLGKLYGVTTSRPPREVAQYDFTLLDIAGKSGSDFIDNKRYKNVEFVREIGFANRSWRNIPDICEQIIEWLAYLHGYQEFEDTDHPDMVTRAVLENFPEVQIILRRIHKAELKFSRIPFWYKKSSLLPTEITTVQSAAGVTFNNPFLIDSKPILEFYLSSGASNNLVFTLGGKTYTYTMATFTVNSTLQRYVKMDCETGNVEMAVNDSTVTTFADADAPVGFPVGSSEFKITSGSVDGVKITPRWRKL